jgi:hypothetical protein
MEFECAGGDLAVERAGFPDGKKIPGDDLAQGVCVYLDDNDIRAGIWEEITTDEIWERFYNRWRMELFHTSGLEHGRDFKTDGTWEECYTIFSQYE